jgi:hypothetical protein
MITIHKYPLNRGITHVSLPVTHEILTADLDPMGQPCIWVRLDDGAPKTVTRTLVLAGTGHAVPHPQEAKWVNTFREGPYVWHVFKDGIL